jgi:hypothetical protein
MKYNVVMEIWESALLIHATEALIDNQHFFIPSAASSNLTPCDQCEPGKRPGHRWWHH